MGEADGFGDTNGFFTLLTVVSVLRVRTESRVVDIVLTLAAFERMAI